MNERGYRKLIAWQVADDLAYQIYLITKQFPKEELYGITSQIRRAAISVPTNIAEGNGRQNKSETRHFLNIALGSITETEYLMGFCKRLGFLTEEDYSRLEALRERAGNLLFRLFRSY